MATFSGYNVFNTGDVVASNPHNENWDDIAAFVNALADGTGIDAGAIINALLATNAVATTNIQDLAVTTGKLGASAVTTAKIADSNVTTAKITDLNVTTGKLADNAVTAIKIATGTITNTEINAAAAIALSKLAVLTGYVSGAGVVAATDSILQAIEKLNGNDATNANLTGPITSVGNATTITNAAVTGIKIDKNIRNVPVAPATNTYTVVDSDYILSHTGTGTTTLTLPLAASYAGRSLQIRNTVPQVIVSSLNNIVALTSAGTPRQVLGINLILSGTDGAWCELVSNGTNWLIVNASELT